MDTIVGRYTGNVAYISATVNRPLADSSIALLINAGYVEPRSLLVWVCGVVTSETLVIPDMATAGEYSMLGLTIAEDACVLVLRDVGVIFSATFVNFGQ